MNIGPFNFKSTSGTGSVLAWPFRSLQALPRRCLGAGSGAEAGLHPLGSLPPPSSAPQRLWLGAAPAWGWQHSANASAREREEHRLWRAVKFPFLRPPWTIPFAYKGSVHRAGAQRRPLLFGAGLALGPSRFPRARRGAGLRHRLRRGAAAGLWTSPGLVEQVSALAPLASIPGGGSSR